MAVHEGFDPSTIVRQTIMIASSPMDHINFGAPAR